MSQTNQRLLIAEDNPAAAGVLQFTLSKSGFDVVVATNGTAAITKVQSEKFDAIITDYQMPGANGEEVIRAARADAMNEATPIILCSAKGLELDTVELTNTYQLAKVIYKPFSPRDVVNIVSTLPGIETAISSS